MSHRAIAPAVMRGKCQKGRERRANNVVQVQDDASPVHAGEGAADKDFSSHGSQGMNRSVKVAHGVPLVSQHVGDGAGGEWSGSAENSVMG
eukprot:759403-Hanusia_phi.AAC.2